MSNLFIWHSDSPDAGHPDCICDLCDKPIEESQHPIRIWDDPENANCKELRFHSECYKKLEPFVKLSGMEVSSV